MATTKHLKIIIVIVCVIFLYSGTVFYSVAFSTISTGLASDETMIAHFKEHRSEIEELVKRYREFEIAPNKTSSFENSYQKWKQQDNTTELMEKASVTYISTIYNEAFLSELSNPLWLPNPYSIETAQKLETIKQDTRGRPRESYNMHIKYGMIGILLRNDIYHKYATKYDKIKHFVYIPEVPRIEYGKLLSPLDINGKYYFRKPLLSSLNRFPISLFRHNALNCAWKQIEQQWFLRLCIMS
jgi:uncharacterized membrane-anchored protein YitT (DUF2179 family)